MRMIWTGIAGKAKTAAAAIALTALLSLSVVLPATAQNAPGNGLMWDGYVVGKAVPVGHGLWLACEKKGASPVRDRWVEGAPCVTAGMILDRAGSVRKQTLNQLVKHWLDSPSAKAAAVGVLPAYVRTERPRGGANYYPERNLVVIVYKRND